MKRYILFLVIFGVFILFGSKQVYAAEVNHNIVMLEPTEETREDLPVYMQDGNYEGFDEIYNSSIIKDFIRIYNNSLKYSKNANTKLNIIFKKDSGCYGGNEFYLKDEKGNYEKKDENYIELSTGMLKREGQIGGITEIFPHELGHVIYGMSAKSSDFNWPSSSNMHYSDVITSYHTAFNEGFAEHFQKIAIKYEQNDGLKERINKDLEIKEGYLGVKDKIKRDFNMPLRLEFYRVISPFWQSKYEEIKRLTYDGYLDSINQDFDDLNKSLVYNSLALEKGEDAKSYEKSLSTELVVANFFFKLVDEGEGVLDERYEKIVNVFSKYLNSDDMPEIIQFVNGYINEYPKEKDRVLQAFKEATGHDYKEKCKKEIFLTSEESYSNSIMDQYGANKSKCRLNINICDYMQLMSLGLSKEDSKAILDYRNNNDGFNDISEINNIDNLSKDGKKIIFTSLNNSIDINEGINLKSIIIKNLEHLLAMSFLWFLILLIPLQILDKKLFGCKEILKLALKYIGCILVGIAAVMGEASVNYRGESINSCSIYCIIVLIIQVLRITVKKKSRRQSIKSTILFSSIIIYSLI